MRMTTLRIIPVLLALFLAHAMGGEPRIAILGDSIPYSGQWPALVEAALRQTPAYRHAEIVSMALPSETVSGLSEPGHAGGAFPRPCLHDRLDSILSKYAPTLVIACYGMNDGMMQPFSESGFQAYQQGMERLKKEWKTPGPNSSPSRRLPIWRIPRKRMRPVTTRCWTLMPHGSPAVKRTAGRLWTCARSWAAKSGKRRKGMPASFTPGTASIPGRRATS
ncbi:hypothetical protein PVA48_02790 [Akkermansia sp. JRP_AM1]|uniref:hypothetical protein n=1 Tax=Akkermansia sp. JRP_AM1 TaxID=3414159 RepID=UPI003BFA69BD